MPRDIGKMQAFPIGLGCISMTPRYGRPDPTEAITTIYRAAEIGVNVLGTFDAYAHGENEELVGKAIAGRRDKLQHTSKFDNLRFPDGQPAVNGRPEYVPKACKASLKRLGTDVIDLYLLHRVDAAVPIEDKVGVMNSLVEQGKARQIGLSEAPPATLRRAHAIHPSKEPDVRRKMPRFSGENLRRNREILALLEKLAAGEECTPAQLAISWLLRREPHAIPIPGTGKRKRLEENAAAVRLSLSEAPLRTIDRAFVRTAVAGTRYPATMMAWVGL